MRTENGQSSAPRFQTFSADAIGGWRTHLMNGNLANMGMRCRRNVFDRNAPIDDSVIIADNLRDRHGAVVEPFQVLAMHRVARQVEVAEISRRNEGEATRSDREIEAESDRVTPVSKTKAWPETGRGRQWSPAAII